MSAESPGRAERALRARLTIDRLALAIVLVGAALLVFSLVQGSSGSEQRDGAVRLVPPDALLYVHARVEPDSEQWRRAGEIVRELPALRRLRDRALDSISRGRRPLDFDTQVRPWIGDEAAVALLPDGRRATSLILVRVADQTGARTFLQGAGRPTESRHRGVIVRAYGGLAASFVGKYLAVGSPANVRAAIDARRGASLARSRLFRRAVDRLRIDDALAYAWAPEEGVSQVVRGREPLVDQVRALVERPGLDAAAGGVRAERNAIQADPHEGRPLGDVRVRRRGGPRRPDRAARPARRRSRRAPGAARTPAARPRPARRAGIGGRGGSAAGA